jgi:GT2 family glycosyltransferase
MNNILAVIVLYNTPLYKSKTYISLLYNNSLPLFIYDNSPVAQDITIKQSDRIIYIHNPENPGLSYAYNRAAEYARNNGFDWMLLLDQDTIFAENILSEYEEAISNNPGIKLFVPPIKVHNQKFLSPVRSKHRVSYLAKNVPSGVASLGEYSPVNSGMMILVDAFLAVGGYNEKVRIDYSDFQFLERFRRHYDEFFVLKSVCFQEFSNEVQNTEQLIERYKVFCECLKNCDRENISDNFDYLWIVGKRALSLTLRTKRLNFLGIFFKDYL